MATALEQVREDAALGAAWRRASAALPEGDSIGLHGWGTDAYWADSRLFETDRYPTPVEALEALASVLELPREDLY